jgi:hypothetical protein
MANTSGQSLDQKAGEAATILRSRSGFPIAPQLPRVGSFENVRDLSQCPTRANSA